MVPQSAQGPNFEKDSSSIFSVQFSSVFTVTSQPPKVQIKRENEEIWGNMTPNPIKQKLQTQHLASMVPASLVAQMLKNLPAMQETWV